MKKNYPFKKNLLLTVFSIFFVAFFNSSELSAQVGIGTSNPDPSAVLHIQSTNKGVLLPKVDLQNLTDRNTVNEPTEGLLVYNRRDDNSHDLRKGFYIWDNEKWDKVENQSDIDDIMDEIDERFKELEDGTGWALTGNNFDNVSNAESKFLGTTTWHSLFLRSNDKQIAEFDPHGGIALGFDTKADWAGIAIGNAASITADEAVAIGKNSKSGSKSISLGHGALATSNEAIGLGFNANSSGSKATAIGNSSVASANNAVAIGQSASASGNGSFAIGSNSKATQNIAFAIGDGAKATSSESFAIGQNAHSDSDQGMAIGVGAKTSSEQNALALGVNSQAFGNNSMALGHSSNVSGQYAAAIGYNSKASQQNTTALGSNSNAVGQNSTAIGYQAKSNTAYSIVLGNNVSASNWEGSKVGIGTSDPTAKLHVNGTLRYVNGSQGANKILTSDANGNANWNNELDVNKISTSALKISDGTEGVDKVLTSDANGNASWKVISSGNSSNPIFGEIFSNSNTSVTVNNLNSAQPLTFGSASYKNSVNTSNNNLQVTIAGIYRLNYNVTIEKSNGGSLDLEIYCATGWSSSDIIPGTTSYITLDSNTNIRSVSINKFASIAQYKQVYVFYRKISGNKDSFDLLTGGSSFNIELAKPN